MSPCDDDILPEYALGTLPAPALAAVEAHLAGCRACVRELDQIHEALAATLAPIQPPAGLRDRVLASTERGRFAAFANRFATLFDVTVDRARALLDLIDEPSSWEPGPGPDTWLIHFDAGPATAGADTGFVKVRAGVTFPWHHHRGLETNLVLQGSCVDIDGSTYERGDVFVNQPDTGHEFRATGAGDYIYAVVVFGVDFDVERPGER